MLIVDTVIENIDSIRSINLENIEKVTVLKGKPAIAIYGGAAKNGAIILETKTFVQNRYINFLRSYSKEYDSLYRSNGNSDTLFQYFLNEKVLSKKFVKQLPAISSECLIRIRIIDKKELERDYNIKDKNYGIIIHCEKKK